MSEQHKHLTTPWEAKGGYVFAGKDCIAICDTDNADEQTYEAKARLMAASQDLLSALKALYDYLIDNDVDGLTAHAEEMGVARAALAKAEGRHDGHRRHTMIIWLELHRADGDYGSDLILINMDRIAAILPGGKAPNGCRLFDNAEGCWQVTESYNEIHSHIRTAISGAHP